MLSHEGQKGNKAERPNCAEHNNLLQRDAEYIFPRYGPSFEFANLEDHSKHRVRYVNIFVDGHGEQRVDEQGQGEEQG